METRKKNVSLIKGDARRAEGSASGDRGSFLSELRFIGFQDYKITNFNTFKIPKNRSPITHHRSPLYHPPRLQFQILINRIHRQILRRGQNRLNAIPLQLFHNALFFKNKLLGDGFIIHFFRRGGGF